MSLDPPDEWWWYVANDNRGQPNPFVQTRPIAYRFHWTRLRLRPAPFISIAQIFDWLLATTHLQRWPGIQPARFRAATDLPLLTPHCEPPALPAMRRTPSTHIDPAAGVRHAAIRAEF